MRSNGRRHVLFFILFFRAHNVSTSDRCSEPALSAFEALVAISVVAFVCMSLSPASIKNLMDEIQLDVETTEQMFHGHCLERSPCSRIPMCRTLESSNTWVIIKSPLVSALSFCWKSNIVLSDVVHQNLRLLRFLRLLFSCSLNLRCRSNC